MPFSRKDLQAVAFAEMLRIIKEVDPPKPSTKLSGSGTLPSVAAVRHMDDLEPLVDLFARAGTETAALVAAVQAHVPAPR